MLATARREDGHSLVGGEPVSLDGDYAQFRGLRYTTTHRPRCLPLQTHPLRICHVHTARTLSQEAQYQDTSRGRASRKNLQRGTILEIRESGLASESPRLTGDAAHDINFPRLELCCATSRRLAIYVFGWCISLVDK